MALGSAIGTGLFLGSGLAVGAAGPGVIVSYVLAAAIAMLLSAALTEMTVANPTAGSFGVYAGHFLSPFAGYAVRMSYWLMQVVATGGHMVASSIYMRFWFPDVPAAVWIVLFAALLVYLNSRDVATLGDVEYWVSLLKVGMIVVFATLSAGLLIGWSGASPGLANYRAHGGFFPGGFWGVWLGVCFALYSFIGVEVVAVTSGEAADPERTIPQAMRRMVLSLSALYITTIALLVGVIPWPDLTINESPFVTVLGQIGIPLAATIMNAVVLTAALSSANANLYLITRTAFSLARAGYIPARLGVLDARRVPLNALLVSSLGLGAAVVVQTFWPESAYQWFFAVALFGAMFVWLIAFVTHLAFRRHWRRTTGQPPFTVRGARGASVAGIVLITAALVSTWWAPGLGATLPAGAAWLLLLGAGYKGWRMGDGGLRRGEDRGCGG